LQAKSRPAAQVRLSRAAIIGILLLTAVPSGFRDPRTINWRWLANSSDLIANIILYVPFGLFFQSGASVLATTGAASAMSVSIEVGQLFSVRRNAQPVDVLANVSGAIVGIVLGRRLKFRLDRVPFGPAAGAIAIVTAATLVFIVLSTGPSFPRYIARSVAPAVSFIAAAVGAAILYRHHTVARLLVSAAIGAVTGFLLSPVSRAPTLSTIVTSVLFGIAAVWCVESADSRSRICA
jgi:VanZ family protein